MDNKKQYSKFLKSFKKNTPKKLMESVTQGFKLLFEADGMNPVNPDGAHKVAITFEIITPESAEHGDAEERGWLDKEGTSVEPDFYDVGDAMDVLKMHDNKELGLSGKDDVADFLKLPEELKKAAYQLALFKNVKSIFDDNMGGEGIEASSSHHNSGDWYTSYRIDSRDSMESGNTENRGLHLMGFTPEEESGLNAYLKHSGTIH
jgi:hypothetical protein